jgi:ABC-type glycerol-3-phosphate transport system substrate-binding protein
MSRFINRRSAVVVGVLFLLSAAGAYAYFTQTGSGSGTAATGSGSAVVVNQTSTVSGLTPASTAQVLSGDFDNPNPGRVHVATITATVGSVTDTLGAAITGCTTADYQINNSPITVGQNIAAGNGVGSWGGGVGGPTIEMLDRNVDQSACKNAIVHVSYTSN